MGLKVWLPLICDSFNQGTATEIMPQIMGTGITYTAGKLGNAATFPNSCASCIHMTGLKLLTGSYCAWIKVNGSGATSSQRIISEGRDSYTSGTEIYANLAGTTLTCQSHKKTISTTISLSTWYHVAFTFGDGILSLYLNGNLITTTTYTEDTLYDLGDTLVLGKMGYSYANTGNYFPFNGQINDFRVYDYVLSRAEIYELSKGLVVHYKLNEPYGIEEKCNFETPLNIYNNFGVSATITRAANSNAPKFGSLEYTLKMTPDDNSLSSFQTTLHSHGVYCGSFVFKANTKYVFWIYYKTGSNASQAVVGGTASNVGGWTEIPAHPVGGGYWRVGQYRDGSVTTDKTDNIFTSFKVPNAVSGTQLTMYFVSPHLLEGTSEIPEGDIIGDTTIVTDSSGNGYNGTIIEAVSTMNDSSPRYSNCMHISATNQKIKLPTFPTTGFSNSYSFAWWAKISSVSPMHWGFADGVRLNGMYTGRLWNTGDSSNNPLYIPGTTTQVTAPTTGVWHHWVMTGDGTICKVYQDGVHWATAKTYKTITGSNIYINGWNASTDYCSDNLSISDFRIYSTALNPDDVLQLYNVGINLDDLKRLHNRDLYEYPKANRTRGTSYYQGFGADIVGQMNANNTGTETSNTVAQNSTTLGYVQHYKVFDWNFLIDDTNATYKFTRKACLVKRVANTDTTLKKKVGASFSILNCTADGTVLTTTSFGSGETTFNPETAEAWYNMAATSSYITYNTNPAVALIKIRLNWFDDLNMTFLQSLTDTTSTITDFITITKSKRVVGDFSSYSTSDTESIKLYEKTLRLQGREFIEQDDAASLLKDGDIMMNNFIEN